MQETAFDWAREMANGPAAAMAAMKDNLDDAPHITFTEALDREAERLVPVSAHPDHKEAVQAFIEKRKPVFNQG